MPILTLLNGQRVITSEYLTEPGEPIEVRRSWRERLFSRPWQPRKRTRTVIPQVPSRQASIMPNGTIVIHPAMLSALRSAAEATKVGT